MKETLELAAALCREFEGLGKVGRDGLCYPYLCPAGYPTLGYGEVVKSLSVPPITKAEAEARLLVLLPQYVVHTLKACPNLIKYPRRLAAISDFTYNLGAARLNGSTLRKRILAEDWDGVKIELMKWVRGGGRVLSGLVKRRQAECKLI